MYDDDLDDSLSALHDAVLPTAVPVLPTLDLAARVAVADHGAESTGAWFDVTVLPSGRVAVVAGQVPGSGVAPTIAAGGVNAVVRASLLEHEDVATALSLADLHARHSPAARGTSVVLGIVDAADHRLTYATAGHDAPVVVGTGGPVGLPPSGGGLLGGTERPPVCRHELGADDLVLFISPSAQATSSTDQPGSLVALADGKRVVGDVAATCAAVARPVEGALVRGAFTVVAVELRTAPTADLDVDLGLDNAATHQARVELERWLAHLRAPRMDTLSLVHATTELVTNAVEHAHGPGRTRGTARLRATHAATGEILVEVVDRGRWRDYSHDVARGRGLAMAAGLVDDLDVTTDDHGTRARIRQRLCRPVVVERARTGSRPPAVPLEMTHDHSGSVRMSGALSEDEVDQITYALLLASRGGTQSISVELSQVTELSAGGLRLLNDLVRRPSDGSSGHGGVVLHAGAGSPAQAALERAGIAHRVTTSA